LSLFFLCCGLRLWPSLPFLRYVSLAKTLEGRQRTEGNDVIVQHLQRAARDRWLGGLPGILEKSSPDEEPRYPPSAVSTLGQMSDWLSLRFRNAPLGAIGLLLIVLGVMLFPLAASFGWTAPSSLRRVLSVLSILFLLFPPAILSAVYSLFFEKSKFYGGLNGLLVCIVVLLQPLAWHWINLYLPIVCVFTIFCAVMWVLKSRSNS
jgi:hypothetical protein